MQRKDLQCSITVLVKQLLQFMLSTIIFYHDLNVKHFVCVISCLVAFDFPYFVLCMCIRLEIVKFTTVYRFRTGPILFML